MPGVSFLLAFHTVPARPIRDYLTLGDELLLMFAAAFPSGTDVAGRLLRNG
jgi:hypothetical protein